MIWANHGCTALCEQHPTRQLLHHPWLWHNCIISTIHIGCMDVFRVMTLGAWPEGLEFINATNGTETQHMRLYGTLDEINKALYQVVPQSRAHVSVRLLFGHQEPHPPPPLPAETLHLKDPDFFC